MQMDLWQRAAETSTSVASWFQRMAVEVRQLPDTMAKLREGAEKFQVVGTRLEASSSSLEELTRLYSVTLSDSVRRSIEAADNVRTQVDRVANAAPGGDVVASAVAELQKAVASMAALNPFWPPSNRRPN
jgi:hypothetical protein